MTKSSLRIRRSIACAAGLTASVVLGAASPAAAVGPHQHTLTNPAGTHDVAGGFCNGNFAEGTPQNVAISNFHRTIHLGPAGPDGVVTIGGRGC